MRQYFIYYEASSKVDYLILFLLYKAAAAARSATGLYLYNTIEYQSISQLSMNLCALYSQITGDKSCPFSASTLSRFLKSADNELYFSHTNKTIILKNNFSKNANNNRPFVVLNDVEIDFLLKQKEDRKLFFKYYLYIKYYCGYSKNHQTDFTSKQFLAAAGYSDKSNNYISKLSSFNSILRSSGLILIKPYKDENGFDRNIYSFP